MTRTEYEINRAWAAHEPERAKVPQSIWRQLRTIKRELAGPAAAVNRWLYDEPDTSRKLFTDYVYKNGVGRDRVLARIKRSVPGVGVLAGKKSIGFSWLESSAAVRTDAP